MDTLAFLSLVLPKKGYKVVAVPMPSPYTGFKHRLAGSIAEMVELINELDGAGNTVYHACASFQQPSITVTKRDKKTGEMVEKQSTRVAENAAWARSFWVDLDVGELKPYATQREAVLDMERAIKEAGLPPALYVSSGYGVHVYWPLAEDIDAKVWVKIASRLKALLTRLKVQQDNSRTADIASVLRPVGAANRKNPEQPKTVKILRPAPAIDPRAFTAAVLKAMVKLGVEVREKPAASVNDDLSYTPEYPPSSAHKIVERCASIAHFQSVLGNVEEPFWRASIGVLKHTMEGDEIAHEWSQGHPSYDPYETQEKLDRWQVGPASCASFEPFGKCEGCPVRGNIKSPIMLGATLPQQMQALPANPPMTPADPEPETPPEALPDGRIILPDLPPRMKEVYRYRAPGELVMLVKGDDEKPDEIRFICQEYIVPFAVIRPTGDAKQGNRAIVKCWRFTMAGAREEMTLPYAVIATGGKDLQTAFGDVGIAVEAGMQGYLKSWLKELKEKGDDAISAERMGWNGNDFVVGRSLYTPNGLGKAALASSLQGYREAFTPQGDAKEWGRLVNAAYNRKGQEQYQFMVAAGFGAPLLRFVDQKYRGVILSAVSYSSGQGKTTTQRVAMSIYGDPGKLETAYGRQTQNALFERLGAMGNLPFMLDEVTNVDGDTISDLAYAISQGVQKDRLTKNGDLRAQREAWQTLILTSGNRSLINTIAATGRTSDAEMKRIFEYTFEPVADLEKIQADRIFRELEQHYGVAGEVFLDYIVKNRTEVEAFVRAIDEKITNKFKIQRTERYWCAVMSSTLAGAAIARKLGLIGFDIATLTQWAGAALDRLRSSVNASIMNDSDMVAALISESFYDCVVTNARGDRRSRPAMVVRDAKRGVIAGRFIIDDARLFLHPTYIKKWADKTKVDFRLLERKMIELGALTIPPLAMDLMQGIRNATHVRCRPWILDMNKLAEYNIELPGDNPESPDNVVPLVG